MSTRFAWLVLKVAWAAVIAPVTIALPFFQGVPGDIGEPRLPLAIPCAAMLGSEFLTEISIKLVMRV